MLKTKLQRVIQKLICRPIYHIRYIQRDRHFEGVQTICLPIGFSNCANQNVCNALAMHPKILMFNQLNLLENWWDNLSAYGKSLAWRMLISDIQQGSMGMEKLLIKKQPINSDQITVIGDYSLAINTKVLMKKSYLGQAGDAKGWTAIQKNIEIPVKILFFVRNPYDLISTRVVKSTSQAQSEPFEKVLDTMINRFIVDCKRGNTLLNRIPKEQVFIWRFEENIDNPEISIKKLYSFLGVHIEKPYLNKIVKVLSSKLSDKRDTIDWPADAKARVAAVIEQYDFLSDYS